MSSGGASTSWAAGLARGGLGAIDWIVSALVMLAVGAMTTIVAVQVGLRYGLNQSLDWADEVSRLTFVWSVFLAIPLGIKRGGHLSVVLLTDRLPTDLRRQLFRAMCALSMLLMAIVAWQAGVLMRDQWDEPMSTLDISSGLFMMPVAIGAVHSMLHLLAGIIEGVPPAPPLET